jgi:hypothetical protein
MKRHLIGIVVGLAAALLISGCQPSQPDLPTLAALPTDVPTETPRPTDTPTETATNTPTVTLTPTITNTPTATATETNTPSPTRRPTLTPTLTPTFAPFMTDTPNPNSVRILTATAAIIEAPTLATLTPIPDGAQVTARPTSTGTPLVAADVIITEQQFQEQLELLLADNNDVDSVHVDFQPTGIYVTLTASGGQAFSSGTVEFGLQIVEGERFNNVLVMSVENIVMQGGGDDIPQAFFDVATGDLYISLYDSLAAILDTRLGRTDHDLENMTLTDTTMDIFLYVPH